MFEIFVDSAANIPAELVKAFKIKVLSPCTTRQSSAFLSIIVKIDQ